MSDNIIREPYRNAWYKQLSDNVDKLQSEINEASEHLVPEVGEDDNGKILVAGEDGYSWSQPPEELPEITSGDEGKVLKVESGLPIWADDSDNELPAHTSTESGKVLKVDSEGGLEWGDDSDNELPTHTSTESGKVLKVDSQGDLEWGDIPSELPSATSADEGKVLTVNSSGNSEWKDVPENHNYSTTEHVVGTWIDGKPVYERTFDCGLLGNSTTINYIHGITNISKFVELIGVIYDASNLVSINSLPLINGGSDYIRYGADATNIWFKCADDWSAYGTLVTVRYTKTTD